MDPTLERYYLSMSAVNAEVPSLRCIRCHQAIGEDLGGVTLAKLVQLTDVDVHDCDPPADFDAW